ncbi:hypothetical protein [Streptosporangium sp. NPDC050280]|uniref:hypothetical protein n=1 Tax=unclassified Streptosporangium TaxID=2632669 RepID=UPI00342C15F3
MAEVADEGRSCAHPDETKAVAKTTIHRLLSRRDLPLREKTLWRMLYETAARAAEILALNVKNLDLGDAEVPLQLIMARTRHKNPRTAMRYTRPGSEAIAAVTEHLAPSGQRR